MIERRPRTAAPCPFAVAAFRIGGDRNHRQPALRREAELHGLFSMSNSFLILQTCLNPTAFLHRLLARIRLTSAEEPSSRGPPTSRSTAGLPDVIPNRGSAPNFRQNDPRAQPLAQSNLRRVCGARSGEATIAAKEAEVDLPCSPPVSRGK